MDPFDGYPYVVTRIGHTPLRHITLLPADWPRARLVELARRQRDANRLDTCLALDATGSVFFDANGIVWVSTKGAERSPRKVQRRSRSAEHRRCLPA